MPPCRDVALCVIGGRGPHGLVTHLSLQDQGFTDYCLLDPAPSWLPLYSPQGATAVRHLRSPRELDFSLGDNQRSMANFVDSDGTRPLAGVYGLQDAQQNPQQPQQHAERSTFWRYANHVAKQSKADDYLVAEAARRLEPDTTSTPTRWRITTTSGHIIRARAVILATGLVPHYQAPRTWLWWEHLPAHNKALALQPPQLPSPQAPSQQAPSRSKHHHSKHHQGKR